MASCYGALKKLPIDVELKMKRLHRLSATYSESYSVRDFLDSMTFVVTVITGFWSHVKNKDYLKFCVDIGVPLNPVDGWSFQN